MTAGQKKPEAQWTTDERKAANLDQRLKSIIMSVLPDDQMNSVINCLTAKSTWDDLILYHEGPYDVKESKAMDLKLCYNTLKFKEDNIYEAEKSKSLVSTTSLSTVFFSTSIVQNFQDSPDDEEDTRSSHEYLKDLEEECQEKALLAKSKRFFKKGTQRFSAKAADQTECHKCGKKGHFARDYWSKTSVPLYQSPFQPKLLHSFENKPERRNTKDFEAKYNKVKAKLALLSSNASAPSSFSSKNKVSLLNHMIRMKKMYHQMMKKLKSKLSWHLLTKEEFLLAKKVLETCINEQIPSQKKKILGISQLTEDTSSFESKDLVFVKSLADNSDMSITSSTLHKSSKTEDSTLPNHNTVEVPSNKSQRNTTAPLAVVSDSPTYDYDSADESSVCSTPFLPPKKLDGAEPSSGPKTVKSILKSKSTFKAETLKAPASKLKNVNVEDDPPLAMVMKELNELKLKISKNKSSYSRNKNTQQVPLNALQNKYKTQFKMNCELCGQNNHLSENCYEVLFCKKCKRTNHRTCDHAEFMSSIHTNQHHIGQGESSLRSRPSRPLISFPSCIHYGYNNHHSDDCLYYPTCEIYGSYDHNTHDHNMIISQRRGINPRNPQHVTKIYETYGSNVHTTSDHNDIERFRKRETSHAKKVETSNTLRSKTPTKGGILGKNYHPNRVRAL
nr:hypothetical protein [Tanacetum cinerariifolium]